MSEIIYKDKGESINGLRLMPGGMYYYQPSRNQRHLSYGHEEGMYIMNDYAPGLVKARLHKPHHDSSNVIVVDLENLTLKSELNTNEGAVVLLHQEE